MSKGISTKPEKIATLATLPPRTGSSLTLPTLADREGKITVTRLISTLEQQAHEFRIRFSFWQVFSIFFLLWALFFWPALHDAWWAMDDFWAIGWTNAVRWGRFVVGNGRPLLGVWSYSYLLDNGPGRESANILLHWIQGCVHVLNATLLAALLWRVVRSWQAIVAVLPFLLWPFNADAVLWRGGSVYAIAACLSLLGLHLIRLHDTKRDRIYWIAGSFLCGLSMLATQATAFAGIVVWPVLVGLTALQQQPMPWRRLMREAAFLATGSIFGAALSYYLIKTYPLPPGWFRGALATDFKAKVDFLLNVHRHLILFPTFYPTPLKTFHVLLGALAFLAVVFGRPEEPGEPRAFWRSLIAFFALLSCLVLPFAAQLVVADSLIFLRALYLGPIFFTASVLIGLQIFRGRVWLQRGYGALLFLILISYWPIAWGHSAEYVKCYKGDLEDLRRVQKHAAKFGLTRVMVVPGMSFRVYNPRRFQYFFLCDHMSSLACPWVRELFIRRWAGLQPVCQAKDAYLLNDFEVDHDGAIMSRALKQKKDLRVSAKPQFRRIEGHDVMGIFLP